MYFKGVTFTCSPESVNMYMYVYENGLALSAGRKNRVVPQKHHVYVLAGSIAH